MSLTPDELLDELAAGRINAEAAANVLEQQSANSPAEIAAFVSRIEREVVVGRLLESDARSLLAVIERRIAALPMDRTLAATQVRASATRAATQRRDAPLKTLVRDADDTLTAQASDFMTQARTLATPLPTERKVLESPASQINTQVLGEHGAKSLDAIETPRRVPLGPGALIKERFLLETQIGKGGMGLVFAAVDRRKIEAQDPNPRVALKVLNGDFERHPQAFIALQREARKAQTLAHPNVVTVFDFDRDGEIVYLTMELLRGRSLESLVREARGKGLPAATGMPIIRGIAAGLAYAHRKGIVHSDLKPGNVFVTEDGTAKILDFGIARAVPGVNTAEIADHFDAGTLGAYTEAYATDEMIDGTDPHPADDLYALGIISYELLTGYHPYRRLGAPAARKLGLAPPALKGIRRREAKALERCLSFERKDRPKDAGDLLRQLHGVSTLQKVSIGTAAVLALTAGYFAYENYVENSPSIAFEELPAETQQDFVSAMDEGDRAWQFFEHESNTAALNDAIQFYSMAYALHPRNRSATAALRRAADAYLQLHGRHPDERRQAAAFLRGNSDFFLKYPPAVEAAK